MEALRPKPFRGDVIAAGVVVLVTAMWVIELRWTGAVGPGTRLAYLAAVWAFVTVMAVLAVMERPSPRAYQTILYLASLALAVPALVELAHVLGAARGIPGTGAQAWIALVLTLLAAWFAARRNSATCTLLAAIAAGQALLDALAWLSDGLGPDAQRWVLTVELVVFLLAAVGFHGRRHRHGVAFADAAGFTAVLLGLTLHPGLPLLGQPEGGWGWQLLVLAAGFGLVAYASVDREPGPAWLGTVALVLFALRVGIPGDGLVGWPLVLLIVAGVLLLIGLRPTTPLPPPPDADEPPAPTLPLR